MNEQKTMLWAGKESVAVPASVSAPELDYEWAVEQFYRALYQFAIGLTGSESDAADLTQETYQVLLVKGRHIRDGRKLKSWLFTTLYRRFLGQHRHERRFPEVQVEAVERELPAIEPAMDDRADANGVVAALQSLDEKYRAPLALFYLQELSYREIAKALGLPIGTIMSRLSRGKAVLRKRLEDQELGRYVRPDGQRWETSRRDSSSSSTNPLSRVMQSTLGESAACR